MKPLTRSKRYINPPTKRCAKLQVLNEENEKGSVFKDGCNQI